MSGYKDVEIFTLSNYLAILIDFHKFTVSNVNTSYARSRSNDLMLRLLEKQS